MKKHSSEYVFWTKFAAITAVVLIGFGVLHHFRYSIALWFIRNPPSTWVAAVAPSAQDFFTLTLSVFIEALPFLIVGVLFSTIIKYWIAKDWLLDHLPKNTFLRRCVLSCVGVLLPVCECGNIPLMRGLLVKGIALPDALVFLLTAPIINPITIMTTIIALSFIDPTLVWWRIGATFIIAQIVAFIVARLIPRIKILTPEFEAYCASEQHSDTIKVRKVAHATRDFQSELWLMLKMVVIGAMIAAAVQSFVPREILMSIGQDPVLSVLAMVALGITISICSSVDAFFALAYARTFTPGAITGFLVAGPMVDIKIYLLLKTTFTHRFIALLFGIVITLSVLIGVGINYVR